MPLSRIRRSSVSKSLNGDPTTDPERVSFLHRHFEAARTAVESGIPLRGYFVWSLLDNFEWAHGYGYRFGIVHVVWSARPI